MHVRGLPRHPLPLTILSLLAYRLNSLRRCAVKAVADHHRQAGCFSKARQRATPSTARVALYRCAEPLFYVLMGRLCNCGSGVTSRRVMRRTPSYSIRLRPALPAGDPEVKSERVMRSDLLFRASGRNTIEICQRNRRRLLRNLRLLRKEEDDVHMSSRNK